MRVGESLAAALEAVAEALRTGAIEDPRVLEAYADALASTSDESMSRAKGLVDIARYFYVAGAAARGVRVAETAKRYALSTAQVSLTIDACNVLGLCAADVGDFPRAMEAYAEGLNLAARHGATVQEAKLWQNTGGALNHGGLFREALACFQRVLALCDEDPAAKDFAPVAHSSIALCLLSLDEVGAGLSAVKKALAISPEPKDANSVQNRVLAENYYTRLLIEVADFEGALQHAAEARRYASMSRSPRSDIQASVAEGLAEAFSGQVDVGITRLSRTLERARELKLASREVLVALVKALEFAGRHEEALKYLKEMLSQQRQTAEANVLQHVRVHLAKLHERDSDTPMEDLKQAMRRVETRVEIVEGKAAKVELARHRQELFKARVEAMERLAVAAELRDDSTGEHSYRVGRLACILAKEAGCDDETIFMIDIAARLHDVGKIGIPDGILLKPSGFNPAERVVMEMHAEIGADVLVKSEIPHIKMAEEIARHHHERWDGKGYPAKIGGTEIPLAARITSLADVFDALTHKRPYKPAWTFEAATSEILASSGSHFDPELTKLFLLLINRLKREHRDLDHFLGEAARASPFIQARGKIWDTLRLAREEYQEQFNRSVDLQR